MFYAVIPQGHCLIVERFGKPVKVVHSGLHFFIPVLDKAKDVSLVWGEWGSFKNGILIELTEQILDTKPREYFTQDNVKLNVNCAIRWRVVNPIPAVYEVDSLHKSLIEATLSEVRSYVGAHDLNHLLTSRQQISEHMTASLQDTAKRWGVNVIAVEIQELQADDATVDAMRQQMEASRKAEALKLEAEGKATAMLKEAEAAKQAAILRAEGEAQALQLKADSEKAYHQTLATQMTPEEATKVLIATKTLDAYRDLAKEPANKVFYAMPDKVQMLLSDGLK